MQKIYTYSVTQHTKNIYYKLSQISLRDSTVTDKESWRAKLNSI